MKPTWKNTFNTDLQKQILPLALSSAFHNGYPYISWGDWVYDVDKFIDGEPDARICSIEELDK